MNKNVTFMSVFKGNWLKKISQVCAKGKQRTVSTFIFSQFFQVWEPPNEDGEILLHWEDQIVYPNTPNYFSPSMNMCTCKNNWWQN